MNMRYLLAAALLTVLTGCQAVVPSTTSTPVATEVVTEQPAATVQTESIPAVTETAPLSTSEAISPSTEATGPGQITGTERVTSTEVQGIEVSDSASLLDALRAAGAAVEPTGEMEQPFLSVPAQQIMVNGGNVQVFEYPSADAAAADAAQISPDGSSTSTTMITWIEPPHFYRNDRLLVLYIGSDEATQELLTSLLGPQFAGQ
jgi:hypothetical protein